MSSNILDGFQLEADFAEANGICRRTATRYRKEVNGLPFTKFGGKIYIHVEGARQWLERRRVQRPNPSRGAV